MHFKPLEKFKNRFKEWGIEKARGPHATPFLAFLSFIESVFFPVPVDIFLIPLVIIRAKSWVYYTIVASVASVLGGVVGYLIGFFFFAFVGVHLVAFYNLEAEVALVNMWLLKNVFWATFISAFTPIPYKVFTLSAGLFQAAFLPFLIASILGRSLRYILVSFLAHVWGATVARFVLRNFTIVTFVLFFGVLAVYFLAKFTSFL